MVGIFVEVCKSRGFGDLKFDENIVKLTVDEELKSLDNFWVKHKSILSSVHKI